MTTAGQDEADWLLLKLANEKGKFALGMGVIPDEQLQLAFERGIDADWFMLVDVSPLAAAPMSGIFRIFRLTQRGHARRAHLERHYVVHP